MVEAQIRRISQIGLMTPRISDARLGTREDVAVTELFVFIRVGRHPVEMDHGTLLVENSHHQLVPGETPSTGNPLYFLLHILERLERGLRIVPVIVELSNLCRQVGVDVPCLERMKLWLFAVG